MGIIFRFFQVFLISSLLFSASCCSNAHSSSPVEVSEDLYTENEPYSDLFTDSSALVQFFLKNKQYINHEQEITQFYKNRAYSFAWFIEGGITEQAVHFVNMYNSYATLLRDRTLQNGRLDSLVHLFWEEKELLRGEEEKIENTELLLTSHFFEFSNKVYMGSKENPQQLSWYIPRKKLDMNALLEAMTDPKKDFMEFREPVSPYYKNLKQHLLKIYELEAKDTLGVITMVERKLELGDSSHTIALIRAKLHLWGDLKKNNHSPIFDEELQEAVKMFQSKRGLAPDGVIGAQTLSTINVSICQVTQQIMLNLERMRWIPFEQTGDFFVVNIPEYMLHIFENGKHSWSTEVIVGKAATSTVIFNDIFEFVVFSPFWNIPRSIQRNSIEPAVKKNPNYLKNNNMERMPNGTIRQRPGPSNALGKVKFLFPNSYSIYLHDTPSRNLFNEPKRLFSHGCIRVKNPEEVAAFLLKDQPEWTDELIDKAMNANTEKYVRVKRPVQIFITYFTAWVDRNGDLQLREDVYGHDRKLGNLLFTECF